MKRFFVSDAEGQPSESELSSFAPRRPTLSPSLSKRQNLCIFPCNPIQPFQCVIIPPFNNEHTGRIGSCAS